MPWIVSYEPGEGQLGIGVFTATYSTAGSPSAKVSRLLDVNDSADFAAYIAECRAALAASAKLGSDASTVIDKIAKVLNG